MPHYEHLFTPIRIGNMTVPNRICHVPTDVSSSNADGSVSERDIHHHSEIAKGGAGLIIVGATSPDGMASAYSAKRTPATSASPGSSTSAWTDARL